MDAMLRLQTPALALVLRATVVYVVVLAGLRLAGKREVGQFTPFDLVLVLLIANAVQNAMVGPDTSLLGGLIAAVTLLAVNFVVGRLTEDNPAARRLVLGQPTLLVHDGVVQRAALEREGITDDELLSAIREHGFEDVPEVRLAVLEVDGSISIVPMSSAVFHSKRRVRQIKHG
ncbi:MAG: DUF421 domain-containing protein [Actinomycetia bacterium]|nr:DUF421 domain-containing protein [Actinomycetes bacterium]